MRRGTKLTGFTLVELLVVIAIIGIMVSLIMNGVVGSLITARRAKCASQLQQLCTAAANYEMARNRLPGYCQKFGEFHGGMDPTDPGNFGGSVPAHVKIGSWPVALLEKLDNQTLYETWTEDQYPLISNGAGDRPATLNGYSVVAAANVGLYQCPSASGSISRHGLNNYIANTGLHLSTNPFTYTRPGEPTQTVDFARSISSRNAVFTNRYAGFDPSNPAARMPVGKPIRMEDFKDGRSYTMLLSESNQAEPWHRTRLSNNTSHLTTFSMVAGERVSTYPLDSRYLQGAVWHFEDSLAYAGAAPVLREHKINGGDVYNDRMSTANMADIARPSSLHPGGVNIGYADGHVTFVTDAIDYRIYQSIMTPNTRSSDMPENQHVENSDAI